MIKLHLSVNHCFQKTVIYLFLVIMGTGFIQAQKTDVVILKKGDRLIGEIKTLIRGKIELSTDDMGTVFIEWIKIASIISKYRFEIETKNGEKYFGSIQEAPETGKMVVAGETESHALNLDSVIGINRFKQSFFKRLEISFDVGFSYAKANQSTQWDLRAGLVSRTRKAMSKLDAVSFFTDSQEVSGNLRNYLQFAHERVLKKRKAFYYFIVSGEQNQELELDLRLLLGGGFGYYVSRTSGMNFTIGGGLVETTEKFADIDGSQMNTEAMLVLHFETYKFEGLKMSIRSDLVVYPSITSWGRIRIDFDVQLRIEIFKNFNWGLNFFDKFDSQPAGAEKNDFVISTSIGWSRR